MSFTSPEGRPSSDVGLMHVANDAVVDGPFWVTETGDIQESAPHLARYGDDRLLAGWLAESTLHLAEVDDDARIRQGAVSVAARIAPRDDFVSLPGGDVAWSFAWDDPTELKIVRARWCELD